MGEVLVMREPKRREKLGRRTYLVDPKIIYPCPICKEPLDFPISNVFNRVDHGFETGVCKKCNRRFQLAFREIIPVVGAGF